MNTFQAIVSLNMTLWSLLALTVLYILYQRGKIQYETVTDVITVEALSGNVNRTIQQYRAVGYEPIKVTSHGAIQRIALSKNVRIPKGRSIW
jgi:hypothetical protein